MKNRQVILDMDDYLGLVDKAKESSKVSDTFAKLEKDYHRIIGDFVLIIAGMTNSPPDKVMESYNNRDHKYLINFNGFGGISISKKTT